MKNHLFSILILSVLISCTNSGQDEAGVVNIPVEENVEASSILLTSYNLPAPMEVAESIHRSEDRYMEEQLVPVSIQSTTRLNKALLTGMYGVDLGYALIYDRSQEALVYLEKLLRTADELKLMHKLDPEIVNRFRENLNDIDSTTFIVMSTFNLFQDYLQNNNDQKTGLYIFSGSFIEGLHLVLVHYDANPSQELENLIAQQKIFIENIVELLAIHEPQGELIGKLEELKRLFDEIELTYLQSDNKQQNLTNNELDRNQIRNIHVKVCEIRDYFLLNT